MKEEEHKKKGIAILGSTGSIGKQALDVIKEQSDHFEVSVLVANTSADALIQQAIDFQPNCVVIADESKYEYVRSALESHPIKVFAGQSAVEDVVSIEEVDIVLTAMVGFAGLRSTIKAIEARKVIALANKETLVVAGDVITEMCHKYQVPILPVDSEHSAIFQCLVGEPSDALEKIILTASGGPFRGKKADELIHITKEDALKHPNWVMGAKITIDSATLMNKGLEVIEAKWLFGLTGKDDIEVVVHPQSIIHSLVQFRDGSLKAQLGLPDMRLPIQYAFSYPERYPNVHNRFEFAKYQHFTFEAPDLASFPNLGIAFETMRKGGNSACIMNAANEVAVSAFLTDKIGFTDIPKLIEKALENIYYIAKPSLEDYFDTDEATRIYVSTTISTYKK